MAKLDENDAARLRTYEDQKIEQEIHRKLSAVMGWDTSDVQTTVQDSSVVLSGTVADTKAAEQTVLVVFTVKGVRKIDNKIKIRRESAASSMASMTNDDQEKEKDE
ncbi:BON domain-containing protein [Terrimonas sp. NA20]|uniref:BON domain-containing protein n=1 Tax=Terrimonas ginsenosidimutans TaxID=2908004 RepID=A0ABS9KU18_9BACT|nr:BON domain-containing protein [Terrimonas ginsenosidimutans]MCG2615778.1 BON domain-containing protein [Terrimonas ginsenosidimutans]